MTDSGCQELPDVFLHNFSLWTGDVVQLAGGSWEKIYGPQHRDSVGGGERELCLY